MKIQRIKVQKQDRETQENTEGLNTRQDSGREVKSDNDNFFARNRLTGAFCDM